MLWAPGLSQLVGEKEEPTQVPSSGKATGFGSGSGRASRLRLIAGARPTLGSMLMLCAPGESQLVGENEEPTHTPSLGMGRALTVTDASMVRRRQAERILVAVN